jgi:Ice-binding-like
VRHLTYKVRFLGLVAIATLAGMWPMAAQAATVPNLGSAANFAVLGASTVTCTKASAVVGDVGVSPGTAITGFNPDCTLTGTIHAGDAVAAQAQSDALVAYNGLVRATCPAANNLTGTDLGTLTLKPGVYCFDSSAQLTGTLTLSGAGVYIFQIVSTITTATNSSVVVASGAVCGDVFWQVGSSATLGTGTAFTGNILAHTSITLVSGTNLNGRAIALNGAVTMDHNMVTACAVGTGHGNGEGKEKEHCNQGVGNGPEGCDPGNSNQGNPARSNDELGGTRGDPGRQGGNGK